ncbi:HupE/UreJ family protein [Streptomyces sp. CA-249302]|uniref:HupE/UreJ family protein n=1 Tax=Streptomyces sp. CA-249302 TaxID=3240058 RepID=UPI003D9433FB
MVHQLVTHTVLVSIRQDWATGRVEGRGRGAATQMGVIRTDTHTMKVTPLTIDLEVGSVWSGTNAMFLLGAVHAIRPLFPRHEAVVAGFFGLGHGLVFSFVLAEMHLPTVQLALSLAGFNLGIEAMQLLLVLLAMPSLLVLARLPLTVVACVCAALGWLLDRLGLANPVARAADSAGTHVRAVRRPDRRRGALDGCQSPPGAGAGPRRPGPSRGQWANPVRQRPMASGCTPRVSPAS